jgi:hypothetical protein
MNYGLSEVMMSLHVAQAQRGSQSPELLYGATLVSLTAGSRRRWQLLGRLGQRLVAMGRRLEAYGLPPTLSLESRTTGTR